jgi:hypothetical protein
VPNAGDPISRDRLFGGQGDDQLLGGDGRDRLLGGPGNDQSDGQGGADLLVGGPGDDNQQGGVGNDVIFANAGRDVTNGGAGNDRLFALARADVSGPDDTAGDAVNGDEGNDRIFVRDGEQDVVDCGPGFDRVRADFKDIVNTNCEVVHRAAPGTRPTPEDTAPGAN